MCLHEECMQTHGAERWEHARGVSSVLTQDAVVDIRASDGIAAS